jgi:TRAP-type uncharacterized transport system fused permease subunit
VALASYAAAGISGANPMETSVASVKIGLAAFIVPFMFFYNAALLMEGSWLEIVRAGITAVVGVFLLSSAVQGWFMGAAAVWFLRIALLFAALSMIEGGWQSDLLGIAVAAIVVFVQRVIKPKPGATLRATGMD